MLPFVGAHIATSMSAMKKSVEKFIEKVFKDDLFSQASAIAFYVTFALPPLLILLLTFLSSMNLSLQEQLREQIAGLMGNDAALVLDMIMVNVSKREALGSHLDVIGFGVLFFSASVIFAQLQSSLNIIFEVSNQNKAITFIQHGRDFLMRRLVCFGMVLTFVFILIVSLVVSAALSIFLNPSLKFLGELIQNLANFIIFTFLFAAIFKWMPDKAAAISNRAALWGGGITAFLFAIGKFLIGMYLGQSTLGSVYGAAGSLAVLLVWVYYSSMILLFGAEISLVFERNKVLSRKKYAKNISIYST